MAPRKKAEVPVESEAVETQTVEPASEIGHDDRIVPKGTYATDYFKANGIPYCDRCGDQFHSGINGEPVCSESLTDCPRLK